MILWRWRQNGKATISRHSASYDLLIEPAPYTRTVPVVERDIKNAFRWWLFPGPFAPLLLYSVAGFASGGLEAISDRHFFTGCTALTLLTGAMFTSLAKKWMPFVSVAEKIFRTPDWAGPSNIDLVDNSKPRKATDPVEFGTFYYRY